MKICFLGQGKDICDLVEYIDSHVQHNVTGVVTYPKEEHDLDSLEHDCEKKYGLYRSVFEVASNNNLDLLETSNINHDKAINWIKEKDPDLLFCFRLREILKKNFLNSFKGIIVNIHIGELPNYRGSGAMSWMILNNEQTTAVTYHYIDHGIDDGDILLQSTLPIGEKDYPIDIYKNASRVIQKTAPSLIESISNRTVELRKQNLTKGQYFPRLNTLKDGKINFDWDPTEVERFIRAFGWPFAGAFFEFKGVVFHVAEAKVGKKDKKYHKFLNGLVVSVYPEVEVVCGGEIIKIITLRDGNDTISARQVLKPGTRLK